MTEDNVITIVREYQQAINMLQYIAGNETRLLFEVAKNSTKNFS